MAKPSKLEFAAKVAGSQYTHTEANQVHAAIDAIIDDYASISEGVDADTLEGHTEAEVQTHAPASHGNEAHDETFITADDVPSGGGGARGKNGAGFVANMLTLWDQSIGEIPDGFEEVSELTGTNLTVVKYVGGEQMTHIPHSIKATLGASITAVISTKISEGAPLNQLVIEGDGEASVFGTIIVPSAVTSIDIQLTKSDATDATYTVTGLDLETNTEILEISIVVPGESENTATFVLPVPCQIIIALLE